MRDWKPKKRKNKKMKKLFLIIVALFALQMQAQTYTEWSTTNALPTEAGTYRLTTDVTLSAAWVVPEGETVLDLNDHIVKLVKESGTDHVISIGKDRTLTIEDKAATKTTRYWEEHETYHYWLNPSTTDNGLGLTTVGGCITGGTGKGESDEQWGNRLPDGFPPETGSSYVGGGIFNLGKLTFSEGNVVGNVCECTSASPWGGGIFNAGDLYIGKNANVIGNALAITDANATACSWGGGVYHAYSAQSFVNEGSISYNYIYSLSTGSNDGGEGVGVGAANSFTNHGHITYNRGETPHSLIGGVGVFINTYYTNDIVFVNDGSISNNSYSGPKGMGGGVYITTKEGHGKVSFTNSGIISYNSLNVNGSGNSRGAGVNLRNDKAADDAVTMTNEGEISHNTIYSTGGQVQGGGIYVKNSTITNTANGVITDNQVFNTQASGKTSVGGGVLLYSGTGVFYNHGTITRNKAALAGELLVAGTCTLVNYGEISDNMASCHGAGIVTLTNGSCQLLSGTRITGNVCRGTAGEGDHYYGVLDATLAGYGGGIYHAGKKFTIDGGTTGDGIVITGNTALNGGGAMYINNKVVDIKGKVNISGNTLTDTGATPSNVLLYTAENTCKVNVNGALDTTTPIGVGIRKANTTDTGFTPTCGVVTTGYGDNVSTTDLQHFKQDEELYEGTLFDIYKNSDHEVEIGLPVVDEHIDNTARLAKYNGEPISVKIGRTIFGDGCYSTIGLPFDVDETMLKKRFGEDVELMEMKGSTINNRELDVTINFTRATSIEAGKPYLIKVSAATGDVKDPTFTGVVIKNKVNSYETDYVSFIPVFSQTYLENDNQKILFLTGNNTLMWPDSHAYTANFRGLRCYFMLKGVANNARTFNLLFDNETTGIQTIAKNVATGNEYFNLSGQRVSMPQKGVYIKNGKKVIVK